jgi:dCMP deaminase
MLIGVSGNICAGKGEITKYLGLQGFTELAVRQDDEPSTGLRTPPPSDPSTDGSSVAPEDAKAAWDIAIDGKRVRDPCITEFENIESLVEFVTSRWREKFVVAVPDLGTLEALSKRPFFLHVAVDAPLHTRWQRYRAKSGSTVSLELFADASDAYMYGASEGANVLSKAQLTLLNSSDTLTKLYVSLANLRLTDPARLRPTWDDYFMKLADLAALRSNCMKRRVGCVVVRDCRIVATGYNGTPRGLVNCNEGGCARCNSGQGSGAQLSTCLCLHAEENAILEAGRDRLGSSATLYCNTCPCLTCSIKIVQSGIREVVYSQSYSMDHLSAEVLKQGGVELRQFSPPSQGFIV